MKPTGNLVADTICRTAEIGLAITGVADDGAKLTDRVTRWILQRLAIDRMSVSATAKALGVGWDLVNKVALDVCRQLVYGDPCHLDGVRVLGVDEHVWKHTRKPGQA